MDKARYLVEAHLREGRSVAELAAAHSVHRSWLYKLLDRYEQGGEQALRPRSRRPRSCPHETSESGLDREEVARHDAGCLLAQELAPSGPERRGAGPRPAGTTSRRTVLGETETPSFESSDWRDQRQLPVAPGAKEPRRASLRHRRTWTIRTRWRSVARPSGGFDARHPFGL